MAAASRGARGPSTALATPDWAPARGASGLPGRGPLVDIDGILGPDLLRKANHGRSVVGSDGRFVLPAAVRRASVDVGAHLLEGTRAIMKIQRDLALFAIEPMEECCAVWPNSPRQILKTDVQGLDLQVLKSAGSQIQRVRRVKAEVINQRLYDGQGALRPGTEAEFVSYMESQGFRFERDSDVRPGRAWLDKHFVNARFERDSR